MTNKRKNSPESVDRWLRRKAMGLPLRGAKPGSPTLGSPEASNALSAAQKAAASPVHPEHPTLFDFPEENPPTKGPYDR